MIYKVRAIIDDFVYRYLGYEWKKWGIFTLHFFDLRQTRCLGVSPHIPHITLEFRRGDKSFSGSGALFLLLFDLVGAARAVGCAIFSSRRLNLTELTPPKGFLSQF